MPYTSPGEHRDPSGFKMQIPAPAVLVGHLVVVAGRHGAAACGNGNHEQRLGVDVAHFAPVETRMRDDYQEACHHERDESDEGEPVRNAHYSRVTERPRPFSLESRWHAARVACRSPGNLALFQYPRRSAFLTGITTAPGGPQCRLNPIPRRFSLSQGWPQFHKTGVPQNRSGALLMRQLRPHVAKVDFCRREEILNEEAEVCESLCG